MVKKRDKTEDYFSLEKKKRRSRNNFVATSVLFIPGLLALIVLNFFYPDICDDFWLLCSGYLDQESVQFIIPFLVVFVVIFGGLFTWNMWNYISAKIKMKDFHKDF